MMNAEEDFDDSGLDDERDPLTIDHDGKLVRGISNPTPPWDSARHLPPETETDNQEGEAIYTAVIKIIKLLVYLLTFALVLGGAIIAKGSLLLMTSQLQPDRKIKYCNPNFGRDRQFEATTPEIERIGWIWVILFAFVVPELGTLVRSLRIGFFKIWHKPTMEEFMIPFVCETLHVIGLGLFVFVGLPTVDVMKGVMMTNCLCLIPSLLGLFGKPNIDENNKSRWIFKSTVDGLVTIFQISGLLLWPLLDYNDMPNAWVVPVSGLLISFGWWENFVDKGSPIGFLSYLGEKRPRMRDTRYFSYVFISIWKMFLFLGVMIGSVWLVDGKIDHLFEGFLKSFQEHQIPVAEIRPPLFPDALPNTPGQSVLPAHFTVNSEYGAVQWALYIQIVAAYVCYIVGKFTCKICIQGFSFAFPVSLAVPATLAVLASFCGMRNDNTCLWKQTVPGYLFWTCPEGDFLEKFVTEEYAWVWLLWLFSQAWITRHVWSPSAERLLSTEKLFMTPMYNSLLIDQSLAMNRKRDNSRDANIAIADDEETNEDGNEDNSVSEESGETYDEDAYPHVIACATMWHENKEEMMEMLKSIFRMDIDQCARRIFKNTFGVAGQGYYEFETHIFFDDAFDGDGDEDPFMVNEFVRLMVTTVEEAACHVHETIIKIRPPTKIPTPYGGRLEWILPGKTKLIAHIKNKNLIRHKKRWSQIMYMYYLLGFKLLELPISAARKDVIAENTYLLALDGDIEFQPRAVELLVDLMKKNKNLGAACGRIHPTGSGPMVWYQLFEYAIGHWFQKATEHVIGCVLCSPGCFSLFRAKALMEDNVMKKYTTVSEEPRHYVQYDQGEDRWLCTLLLQRGYRVEYSAASDANTHAPEGFNEFFNQRRRWVPSTMANIFDLLMDAKQTIRNNPDISRPYIFYQILLMGGSILGPGTIFLMLVGAFVAAFDGIDNLTSLTWNSIPILIFLLVCYFFDSKIQLIFAQILSAIYALVMVAVLVALSLQIAEDGLLAPSSIFLIAVAASFIIAALLHPLEFGCLVHGIVYYITIPSMYLLLIIYSLFNMNNVSWGTREVAKKKSAAELKEEAAAAENAKKNEAKGGILGFLSSKKDDKSEGSFEFSFAGLFKIMCCVKPKPMDKQLQLVKIGDALIKINERLSAMERAIESPTSQRRSIAGSLPGNQREPASRPQSQQLDRTEEETPEEMENLSAHSSLKAKEPKRDPLVNPHWIEDKALLRGPYEFLTGPEIDFWNALIKKYLFPLNDDKEKQAKVAAALIELRNESVFAFFMLNAVFVLAIFLLQLNKDILFIEWPLGVKVNMTTNAAQGEIILQMTHLQLEPIGLVFVAFFAVILIVQFSAMLFHRFGTLSHILSATPLISQESAFEVRGVQEIKKMQKLKTPQDKENGRRMTLDPGRRKTIVNLERQRGQPEIATMDRQFRRNFKQFEQNADRDPNLRGIRRSTLQELRQRRSTVLLNRQNPPNMDFRKSKMVTLNEPHRQAQGQDAASRAFAPPGANRGFVNQSFVPDGGRPRLNPIINEDEGSSGSGGGLGYQRRIPGVGHARFQRQ